MRSCCKQIKLLTAKRGQIEHHGEDQDEDDGALVVRPLLEAGPEHVDNVPVVKQVAQEAAVMRGVLLVMNVSFVRVAVVPVGPDVERGPRAARLAHPRRQHDHVDEVDGARRAERAVEAQRRVQVRREERAQGQAAEDAEVDGGDAARARLHRRDVRDVAEDPGEEAGEAEKAFELLEEWRKK